jgi:GMP synthase-like glutamine amidotransferase
MSKALGGVVSANPYKEIGWGNVVVGDHAEAKKWFGDTKQFLSFHWHGETFTLPEGATHLLTSEHCANQAYALGKHLGFQCHIEMTSDMVKVWCETGRAEVEASITSNGVQALDEIQRILPERVTALNAVAQSVYTVWIQGLKS